MEDLSSSCSLIKPSLSCKRNLKGKGLSVHLVKDGEALPAKGLDQSHVSFRDQPWAWVKVDRVAVPGPQIIPAGLWEMNYELHDEYFPLLPM